MIVTSFSNSSVEYLFSENNIEMPENVKSDKTFLAFNLRVMKKGKGVLCLLCVKYKTAYYYCIIVLFTSLHLTHLLYHYCDTKTE